MVKLAFITGITGQDGSFLAELLLEKGYLIWGIVRRTSLLFSHSRLERIKDKINLVYGDLTDGSSLTYYITKIVEDNKDFEVFEIYNLAAQSHVKISFEIPEYTSLVDAIGTLKILEAIRSLSASVHQKIRFYQAGTSEMFGKVFETPQTENTPFNPQSPYGCAKVYSHYIVNNYRDAYKLFACNGILFNHESERRGENFLTMKVVNGVKKYMKDSSYILKLGNLNSQRDWGYAKDYVRAMWLILQQSTPDNYVIATGETHTIRSFVEKCYAKIGINIVWKGEGLEEVGLDKSTGKILVKIDEKYFRPTEVDLLLGDPTKARNILGWDPECKSINDLIDIMFNLPPSKVHTNEINDDC